MANLAERKLLKAGIGKTASSLLSQSNSIVAKSAIPVILAPSGTVATAGVVTLGTALPFIYANAWVRLPADAVVGGLAGLYYVVFSSTTVGQVYTNFVDTAAAFTPFIPTGTLVPAVGSDAAYTATISADVTLVNVTIPANTLGANGSATLEVLASNNGTAGAKNVSGKFGGSKFLSADVTTSVTVDTAKTVTNRGVVAVQVVHPQHIVGAVSAVAVTRLAINTAAAVSVAITGQVAVATDYVVLEKFALSTVSAA